MQYMGGKAKIARRIVAAILADTDHRERWFEPFVGGGNVIEHAAPHFGRCVGMDAHPDLIMMWQAVADGWEPPDLTRERYAQLRKAEPSAERGYAGFGVSFGGKWFGGWSGDAVRRFPNGNEYRQIDISRRALTKQGLIFRKYDVRFRHALFGDHTPPAGTVVYCDPPYAGTTGYSTGGFDHDAFYKTLIEWSELRPVYVSEYSVPGWVPAQIIWEREKRNVLEASENQRVTVERLYRIGTA